MELTRPSICKNPFDRGSDANIEFTGFPTEWPLGSVDDSSHTFSSFSPHTPSSGRSTPPCSSSLDFNYSSFASSIDTVPFDLSPISCVTSIYLPMTPKAGPISDFTRPSIPITPIWPKYDSQNHPLSERTAQVYFSQTMDCGLAITQLSTHPHLGGSSVLVQYERLSGTTTSNWMVPDSPVNFEPHSPTQFAVSGPSMEQQDGAEPTAPRTPSMKARRRALTDEVRHKTTVLQQQMQQCPSPKTRTRAKKETRCRTVMMADGSFALDSVELASTFKCPIEGCGKMYRRSEHMKRHIQRLHTTNRWDNLKAHIRLHGIQREHPGSKPRVQFAAGAVLQYEEIMKNESRRGDGTKHKKRTSSDS
ncbi:hypothetical protein MYCTH_57823 [Thermothelomyces thermophilus ATCC 42464]|uniref:C2H2-type domain-containing protein n=1 Tax=Thermothelomyces thermophilus (strain ATCC 42464 / BCRC 31852 / DSM 1799) TaxID=573729 RepID=G2QP34_THET4|nr:uncharacterized protein MYCTH_57823 [Thermothelomyces thermophilus ATCC 42464]AEO61355.1 hypothetical protein MYCTH_57823 [Thermothelomyces thermophilus ATCC 42464]